MSKKITDFFTVTTKEKEEKQEKDSEETENEETENEDSPKITTIKKKSPSKKSIAATTTTTTTTKNKKNSEEIKNTTPKSSKKRLIRPDEEEEEEEEEEIEKVQIDESESNQITNSNYYDNLESFILDENWKNALESEFKKPYMKSLIAKLNKVYQEGKKPIYPPKDEIFSAFNCTPLKDVKVVIIGQDPYHGKGQAHGLSFSVKPGVSPPPSLINIYKELVNDCPPFERPLNNGFLQPWAKQGVFLLNAALTVEEATPNSHKDFGWYQFMDSVLKILNDQPQPIVFILWGGFAKKKKSLIKAKHHLILESGHPSPLSVTHFMGCKHFSKTNDFLKSKNIKEIDWVIEDTRPNKKMK